MIETELFSLPLSTGWAVLQNDRAAGLELTYRVRAQKSRCRWQDYDLTLRGERKGPGWQLTLTVLPEAVLPRVLETCSAGEEADLLRQLARLQGMTGPECWGREHIAWINALWEETRQRLGTRHIKRVGPPRPPVPGKMVPLRIPAGWEAAWNTLDEDYPDMCLPAPGPDLSLLHWERDIAMFVRQTGEPPLCLDLEDWSDDEMRLSAFRVHLYRWQEEGPETLAEAMVRDFWSAKEKLEEFFLLDGGAD